MSEINAPVKNAAYKPMIIFGKPKTKPIKKDSLTSPKPIPFPLVTIKIKRKKTKAPKADSIEFRIKNSCPE